MNDFISYVGVVVTVAGALSLMALIAGLAMNYGWRKFNDWLTYDELCKAVKEYNKAKPESTLREFKETK